MISAGRLRSLLVPTTGTVITAAALGWALFGVRLFRNDGDVGRHVRLGRHILETGTIPRVDHFSHTMSGEPFVPYEWLSEVAFAVADHLGGLPGVAVLTGILFAAATLVVFRLCVLLGAGPLLAAAVSTLSMALQGVHLLPRPHLFTTLFAAGTLLILEIHRRRSNPWLLVGLVPLMALWTNLHGGFLVGFVVIGVYVVDAWRPASAARTSRATLSLTMIACFFATLANPVGVEIWSHTLSYFGADFLVDNTDEYRSPDFHQLYGKLFLVGIITGFILLGSGRSRAGFRDLTLFLGWLAAGLVSARNIPLFGVLSVPWFVVWSKQLAASADTPASLLRRLLDMNERGRAIESRLSGAIPTVIVGLLTVSLALTSASHRYAFEPDSFPEAAMAAVAELRPRGNLFNEMPWGGYLLYKRPDVPVFIDGQTDFYGEELSKDYLRIRELAPGALDLLNRYSIDWVLVRSTVPLVQGLELTPDWNCPYGDGTATLCLRAPGSQ
ncbi:MAG: hypothetical protein M8844_10685 [marine benthic group bacterium]|nr:hypothetical protein [Gemmatimonadota bacterium]